MTGSPTDQALGAYITALRVTAGLEPSVLARRLSLSNAQLAQLESGQHSLFYNHKIRQQAARKVIAHLGGDLSRVQADDPPDAAAVVPSAAPPVPAGGGPAPLPVRPVVAPVQRASRGVLWGGLMLSAVLFGLAFLVGRWPGPASLPTPLRVAPAASDNGLAAARQPDPAPVQAQPVQTTEPAEPQPAAEPVTTGVSLGCGAMDGDAPAVRPPKASKPGDMVYVVSSVAQVLCVVDATGKSQQQSLEAGQALSFYGQAPWQLQSSQLRQTQLYFQGWRVRLPTEVQDRIQLVELR